MNAKKNENEVVDPNSYAKFLEYVKQDIQKAQLRAAMSITKEVIEVHGKNWGQKIG